LTLASLAGAVACSSSQLPSSDDLLLPETADFRPRNALSGHDVASDLALLTLALEKGYGGRDFIPGAAFRKALDALQALSLGPVPEGYSSARFCEDVEAALLALPDMHMNARLEGRLCSARRKALFAQGGVGQNSSPLPERAWTLDWRWVGTRRIAVLAITAFPKHEDPAWAGFSEAITRAKRAPAIVIDLRGNGGGDDTRGIELAERLYGGPPPSSVESIVKSQTPETFALALNSPKLRVLRLRQKGEPVPDYIVGRLERHERDYRRAQAGAIPAQMIEPGREGGPYDPREAYARPIVILTDRACASSCESAVEAFEAHPHAVTLGENTGGFCHYGNVGALWLPRSGLVVQIATDFWKYKDGRYVEGSGYAPRVRVSPGRDALGEALQYLKTRLR
jgi:hypothetical protein